VTGVATSARDVAVRRSQSPHNSMFVRMLVRAAVLRRGRAATALVAMVVAAAVTTAVLNLYVDVQAKLRGEFRNYGANIILSRQGRRVPFPPTLSRTRSRCWRAVELLAPFALVVARTSDGQPVVVAGTDFDRVRQLDRWWSVSAWPSELRSRP
jgi:putative ABC transport system permease protein